MLWWRLTKATPEQIHECLRNQNSLGSEQWALLCPGGGADPRHRAEPRRGAWHLGCYCKALWVLPEAGLQKTDDLSFNACLSGPADYNEVLLFYQGNVSRPILWTSRIWVQVEDGNAAQPFPSRGSAVPLHRVWCFFCPLTNTVRTACRGVGTLCDSCV